MFFLKNSNSKPHNWLIHHIYISNIKKHLSKIKGVVLDVGCGQMPYKELILPYCSSYFGIDNLNLNYTNIKPDIIADALSIPIADQSVDTIVSFQVMEHLTEPQQFLQECFRALKKDGHMLITTPFMWGEHDTPNDFYRYTQFGLKYLAEKVGFTVLSINADTGFWTTHILRFNYAINRLSRGFIKYLLKPIWLNQYIAWALDKIDNNYRTDTASYTVLLQKK